MARLTVRAGDGAVLWDGRCGDPGPLAPNLSGGALDIGRGSDQDISLRAERVSRRHARIEIREGRAFIRDRGSTDGTSVNGARIVGSTLVNAADRIGIGAEEGMSITVDTTEDESVAHPPDVDFLWRLRRAPDDDATRAVYMDWLEERGERDRAEHLRNELELTRPDEVAVRALAARLDPMWRIVVARTPIDACRLPGCPSRYSALSPRPDLTIRGCGTCHREVWYCRSLADARALFAAGLPLVLDSVHSPTDLRRRER